jgi:hypothetical protein
MSQEHPPTDSFYSHNLAALTFHRSPTAKWLNDSIHDESAVQKRLFVNEQGLHDVRLGLHGGLFDKVPPYGYYSNWLTGMQELDKSAGILIGSNIGYGINHILSTAPQGFKLYVLEPDPHMLAACFSINDYSQLIDTGVLTFLPPDKDVFRSALYRLDLQMVFGSVKVFMDLPSAQIGSDYAVWAKFCKESLENFAVEVKTMRRSQDMMVSNELHNFRRAFADGSLRSLEGSGKELTAVILGAGPSLAESGPALAEAQEGNLFVTAMQSVKAVQRFGITPHFCMAIDYSPGMLRVYDGLDHDYAAKIPLLYSPKVQPDLVNKWPGPTLPLWTVGGVATFLPAEGERVFDAGGNVSVTLLRFLRFMGVERIFLAGQDFAWKGESSHVGGHHFAKRSFSPIPGKHIALENAYGERVYSAMPYVSALRDMIEDLETYKGSCSNIYGGGLDIRGAHNVGADEAVAALREHADPLALRAFLEILSSAGSPRPLPVFESRSHIWTSSLASAVKRLEKLFRKPPVDQHAVHAFFGEVLIFMKQDPLYAPYIYNDILDVSALARLRRQYTREELKDFKAVVKRVVVKVRELDRLLGRAADKRAA